MPGAGLLDRLGELYGGGGGPLGEPLAQGEGKKKVGSSKLEGIHGEVTLRIGRALAADVERQGAGKVVVGNVGFVLNLPYDPERVRAPDVAFVSSPRLPGGRLPEGFLQGAPDLAIEILSPSDNPVDVQQKVCDYLEAGARLVWVVAPQAKAATGASVPAVRLAELFG